jgi:ubiquinone/menaquinone biosynthesis C-methylase UbiE
MNRLPLALSGAVLTFAQVATEANSTYRTAEGRSTMRGVLGGRDRDGRQKPKELVAALDIKPGSTVVDLGTGIGYMLPYLSAAAGPSGKVIAQDIFQDFLEKASQTVRQENLQNVSFVLGTEKNPNLTPDSADMIIALDAYHHFDYPDKVMAGIKSALKKHGRLVIIDYYKRRGAMGGKDSDRALTHIRLDAGDMVKEVESFGFRIESLRPFLPGVQYISVFEKRPVN